MCPFQNTVLLYVFLLTSACHFHNYIILCTLTSTVDGDVHTVLTFLCWPASLVREIVSNDDRSLPGFRLRTCQTLPLCVCVCVCVCV